MANLKVKSKKLLAIILSAFLSLSALSVVPASAAEVAEENSVIKTVLNNRSKWNYSDKGYSNVAFMDFDFDGKLEMVAGIPNALSQTTYCVCGVDTYWDEIYTQTSIAGSSNLDNVKFYAFYDPLKIDTTDGYFYILKSSVNNPPVTDNYYRQIAYNSDYDIYWNNPKFTERVTPTGTEYYGFDTLTESYAGASKTKYSKYFNDYFSDKENLNLKYKFVTIKNSDSYDTAYNALLESYEAFNCIDYSSLKNPTSVKTDKKDIILGVSESLDCNIITTPQNSKQSCRWSSSDTSVATVTYTGKITAKKAGSATITVRTTNGKTAQCKVTVKPAPTSVSTNPASVTLGVGETYTISESTNSGSYANANNLKWSSSNTSVATVTKGSGNKATITAKGVGTAYIKITLYNGKTAQCKVTVKSAPTSVKTNPTSLTLGKGETYTISESTNSGTYANADNLKWSSSNTSVATVTKGSGNKAKITAKGAGTAYIKITLYNGKTAQCKVTVKSAPTSVNTNPTSVILGKGETYTISEITNSGSYANAANLKWTSSNTSVATVTKVSGNKAKITAKGVGTAYIKITLYNGKTTQCKVTVKNAPSSVSLSKTSLTLNKGATYTISESTNRGTYANADNLKWSSSNTSVATVTKSSGNKAVITAKSKGTSYIKITLYNGKTAQCKVTVK